MRLDMWQVERCLSMFGELRYLRSLVAMSADRASVLPMHGSQAALLKWFKYDHLPEKLQAVSKPCGDLAHEMADAMPNGGAELTAGLRHLLEAKDCFVRSSLNGATSTD